MPTAPEPGFPRPPVRIGARSADGPSMENTTDPTNPVATRPTSPDSSGANPVGNRPAGGTPTVPLILTITESARAAGISAQVLRKRVRRGTVDADQVIRDGRSVAGIRADELLRHYPKADVPGFGPVATRGASDPAMGDAEEPRTNPMNPADGNRVAPGWQPGSENLPTPKSVHEHPQASAGDGERPGDLAQIRAAAARVPDLERRAETAEAREAEARAQVVEERRERRVATAAVLRQLQAATDPALGGGAGPVMIAGPAPKEVASSRRFAYAMAAASVLAVGVLGWRLVAADAQLTQASERITKVVGEKLETAQQAAQLAGELDSTRETLRDEQDRTASLEKLSAEAQLEARQAREIAAHALGVKVMLRTVRRR